ncbi:MAG: 3-deoxy-manno-octulosonate cytidylyltransferase [Proteobacteria bacterium]|nr:3-deoxy-manno-octulosonate cytidylyltransferase [Pseudomonadota bacterium]NIS70158.1 3-deoxy-manno-octulosonate cytidylyltransferase [Pseudomonadota bacterium]
MRAIGVIPARFRSKRFEGKVLADLCGQPIIQHVYERACKASLLDKVLVATDDQRIRLAVAAFGGEAVMTSPDHPSGTDRIAEAIRGLDVEVVVNIQGDEPLIEPSAIDSVARPLFDDRSIPMATLMRVISDTQDLENPNVVKVVTDKNGFALYFSRSTIPYPRDLVDYPVYGHIGVYAYRKDFLLSFVKLEPSGLEKMERLEQLRALENGFRIKVLKFENYQGLGVDTPEDLERLKNILLGKKGGDRKSEHFDN